MVESRGRGLARHWVDRMLGDRGPPTPDKHYRRRKVTLTWQDRPELTAPPLAAAWRGYARAGKACETRRKSRNRVRTDNELKITYPLQTVAARILLLLD